MPDFFFYGPLQHGPLLNCVVGRELASAEVIPTELDGFVAKQVDGTPLATLQEQADGKVQGVLLRNPTDSDLARLYFYTSALGLTETAVDLPIGRAIAYVSKDPAEDDFVDADWAEKWAEIEVRAAQEAMSYLGEINFKELAFRLTMIRVRASAQVAAQKENPAFSPSGYTRSDVVDFGADRKFTGFFSYSEQNISFRQFDGSQSPPIGREVFLASDATIVLPYDPKLDRVMLVEQFRPGPYARNDETPWMLEPIAGRIDPGETPETTAYREAEEEAGLTLTALHEVAKCYASPGCSNEYFNIFVGLADLPDDCVGTHGLDSEAEDIRSYLFSFDKLMEMVDAHQTANAPLVLAALWLARKRDSLRKLS